MADKQKKVLRQQLLAQRISISSEQFEQKNTQLLTLFNQWLENTSFSRIFIFSAIKNEPRLTELIEKRQDLNFFLPISRTSDHSLDFYKCTDVKSLNIGAYGILEPDAANQQAQLPDDRTLICVPALATDQEGHRLGYGAGYYDRYLTKHNIVSMGILFSQFHQEKFPSEKHDQALNYICTENKISAPNKKNPSSSKEEG